MATVSTVTSSINVEVSYVCSVCGTANTTQTQLQVSARNEDKASRKMQRVLTDLASDDPSVRYTHANLTCSCSKCKYSEPWTNLDFYKLDTLSRVLLLIGGVILLSSLTDPLSSGGMIIAAVLCMLAGLSVLGFKKFQAVSSAKKIAELPAKSLPTIRVLRGNTASEDDIMARIHDKMNR